MVSKKNNQLKKSKRQTRRKSQTKNNNPRIKKIDDLEISELLKRPDFEKKFINKCVVSGSQRVSQLESQGADIDKFRKRDLRNFCKCAIRHLSNKTIKKAIGTQKLKELDECVSNLHKTQKTYILSRRRKSTSKKTAKKISTKRKSSKK